MKNLPLIILAALLPSCEAFSKLTPEQQARVLDRGLVIVDAVTGAVVGKINPASGPAPLSNEINPGAPNK